jgi:UDP-2,3-diacylglucosamine pyrophosphatase LpxH
MKMRSLFISDVHLGSAHASTKELLQFLDKVKDKHPPEKLYIVGDFIDGWKLKRNWYWSDESSLVIRKILSFLHKGTEIYYIAGNHDEFMREFIEDFRINDFGHIRLGNEFIHEAADGNKYLVVHGDMFDMVAKYAKWLCRLGDIGYDILLRLNRLVNWWRRLLRRRNWSLSKAIKANVKKAVNYVSDFETFLIAYSRECGCNGCICGHIHTPDLKPLQDGFIYANTGDWVESLTAIWEDHDGKLHLYHHEPSFT